MLEGLPRSLCLYPSERDRMFVGGKHIVHFNLERPVRQLEELSEQANDLVRAAVLARRLITSALVPEDVRGEQLIAKRIHVTS